MNVNVLSATKTKTGEKKLPQQFDEPVRVEIIKRAVHAALSNAQQRYGADPRAGKRHSVDISRRRRTYRGSYGHGISRIPRKVMSRNGDHMNWTGAFSPGTVGGRKAHPPKASKDVVKKINVTERRKAIRSALAATVDKELVAKRGHKVPENYPFLIASDVEKISKTKDVISLLTKLDVSADLERASVRKIRAGKGKVRGRRYKNKIGPLIVVSKACPLKKASVNIPGVDVIEVKRLNAALLAPGAHAGRLTIYTDIAIDIMDKERLYR